MVVIEALEDPQSFSIYDLQKSEDLVRIKKMFWIEIFWLTMEIENAF